MDLISLAYAFSGWNVPPETAGGSKPEETYVHPSVLNPTLTKEEYDKIKGWGLDMTGHAEQCVQRYCELTGANPKNFKKVATPCMGDHQFTDSEMQEKGKLSDVAARAVLKCLYLASVARPDILWTVNLLARNVTKWTKACDRRMERLISYIHHTKNHIHFNYVGNKLEDCFLALFQDASFAGDLKDSKSTSGGVLCLIGSHTYVTLA